jgi:hypothetical protein
MKVTTVRFGADLWRLLETEAAQAGVSTSQYIREAALARASAAAAARGHGPFELLAGALREVTGSAHDPDQNADAQLVLAALARLTAAETRDAATALRGESKQATRQSRVVKARADSLLDRRS